MSTVVHALAWFEIAVTDFARARAFYEALLGRSIEPMDMGTSMMGFIPSASGSVNGALVYGDGATPSAQGTIVYFDGGADLSGALTRVVSAGGSIALGKTGIPGGGGFYAHFIDSEGNKIGLHSAG